MNDSGGALQVVFVLSILSWSLSLVESRTSNKASRNCLGLYLVLCLKVMAGGNVHVHGSLRGYVMAGLSGDSTAEVSQEKRQTRVFIALGVP